MFGITLTLYDWYMYVAYYYPLFIYAFLNKHVDEEKREQSCKRKRFTIRAPKFGAQNIYVCDKNKTIYKGLGSIKPCKTPQI